MIREAWRDFVSAYWRFVAADGLALAGNIAFCAILALFPFLIFLTALAGFFGNEALAQAVVDYLLSVAPKSLAASVSPEIRSILTAPRTDLVTVAAGFTLWTASGAVESVRVGLNRAYGYTEERSYWLRLLQNVVFVLGGAAVLLVLAISIVIGPVVWHKVVVWYPPVDRFTGLFDMVRYPAALILMVLILLAAHLALPMKRHGLGELLPGITLTIVFWLCAAYGYSYYLAHFSTIVTLYGGLTGIIIALTFLYLSGALTIWGGQINQVLISRRAEAGRDRD